jgi:hypothetical protein
MTVAAVSERAAGPRGGPEGPPPATARVVLALARVEGRRLVRHPVFLVGVALSLLMTLLSGIEPVRGTHSVVEPLCPSAFQSAPLRCSPSSRRISPQRGIA